MAFANEHAAQIRTPGVGVLRRENNKFGDGIHAIFSLTPGDPELQTVLFDKRKFTLAQSRTWLKDNDHIALSVETAGKGSNLLTFGDASSSLRLDAISGIVEVDSLPTQRFVKDLIQVGVYKHPVDKWELNVTPEKMDEWIAASQSMEANGVSANVVKDHSFRSDDALGSLSGLFRKANEKGVMTLYGIHTMIGKDSIELAQKVGQVSIWLEPSFVDGKGRSYGEAIIHSSITPQPVVPDQQGFVPIAADTGRRSMAASLKRLSTNTGDTKMNLEQWAKLLGLKLEDLTAENLFEKVGDHVKALSTTHEAEVATLKTSAETLTGRVAELEAKAAGIKDVKPDPDALNMLAEGTEMKIDTLVEKGHLTPKAASILKAGLVGSPEARNARALSRTANNGVTPYAEVVLNALAENKPVDLKQQTGAQVLSRQLPGDDASAAADPAVIKNMVSGAAGQIEKVL